MPPNTTAVAPGQVPTFNEPPAAMPISDVTVIIGYRNSDGQRIEVAHDVGAGVKIFGVSHSIIEKQQKTKDDDGRLLGFEPTGEYELKLVVKYTK